MKSFVKRWFSDPVTSDDVKHASVEPGQRVYGIGDVHGRHDLLQDIHRKIAEDAAGYDGDKKVVYLGDLVDRGMQSRDVIDELITNPLPEFETVFLMGNHEQTLMDFLDYPEAASGWLNWGGRETLLSYGVDWPPGMQRPDVQELRDDLMQAIPERHLEFFNSMSFYYPAGDYLFVHAGVRPGIPLQEQKNSDLLWIRDAFLESNRDHGFVVVHGHSISEEVDIQPNRIGIDTGAFRTGVLTCLVLEGQDRRFLQTGGADET